MHYKLLILDARIYPGLVQEVGRRYFRSGDPEDHPRTGVLHLQVNPIVIPVSLVFTLTTECDFLIPRQIIQNKNKPWELTLVTLLFDYRARKAFNRGVSVTAIP
jgi:hypothetical protein